MFNSHKSKQNYNKGIVRIRGGRRRKEKKRRRRRRRGRKGRRKRKKKKEEGHQEQQKVKEKIKDGSLNTVIFIYFCQYMDTNEENLKMKF